MPIDWPKLFMIFMEGLQACVCIHHAKNHGAIHHYLVASGLPWSSDADGHAAHASASARDLAVANHCLHLLPCP